MNYPRNDNVVWAGAGQKMSTAHGYAKLPTTMALPFGLASRKVYAGPWTLRPADTLGIKLAAEFADPAFLSVPIKDYDVPQSKRMVDDAVMQVLLLLRDNRRVYVGCRGGLGRTGLFLGLLAKTLWVRNPVGYVRKHYDERAIETIQQACYVDEYQPPFGFWGVWTLKVAATLLGG